MIGLLLRLWTATAPARALGVLATGVLFYALEPAFRTVEDVDPRLRAELGPRGLAASAANLAALSVFWLLGGTLPTERRRGTLRLLAARPIEPLLVLGLRWAWGVAGAIVAATLFLVVGQLVAWGRWEGGLGGLALVFLSAWAHAGLLALLGAVLPRGDGWIAAALTILGAAWAQLLLAGLLPPSDAVQFVAVLLPPHPALDAVYRGLLEGRLDPSGALYALGYGAFGFAVAALVLTWRDR